MKMWCFNENNGNVSLRRMTLKVLADAKNSVSVVPYSNLQQDETSG
jgi:TolB-like protein